MNIIDGKRITFKRTRPNPLFQDWLQELYEEAKQKKSELEPLLKEALESISKYPLPLQSGAECAILKGFNKRICLFLDERLETYKGSGCRITTESSIGINSSISSDKGQINATKSTHQNNKYPSTCTDCPKIKKVTTKNKFRFKSGGCAILMVLLDLKKSQSLSKDQIIETTLKYCEDEMAQVWDNMLQLLAKGLVKKSKSNKPKFSLTKEGYSLAEDLLAYIKKKKIKNSTGYDDDEFEFPDLLTKPVTGLSSKLHDVKEFSQNCILSNSDKFDEIVSNEDKTGCIEMKEGSFDIILLIDKCETSGLNKKNDPTVTLFNKYPDLKHEYRSLKVGDFTWIARHNINKGQELVLPYVVERKRMDDLAASIKDGRFHEQKFRLRKCGLNHVIYLVENHGSNKHIGLPIQTLMQALANTSVQDGFKIHITENLSDSIRFLAIMTLRLMYEYKNICLKGHSKQAKDGVLMTFNYFNKSSLKTKALSVTGTFIKLLLQLKGVSVEKALTITNVYKTPRLLIEAYQGCDQKEGEMLLANLRFGRLNRSVGPTVSKSIYQLFTFKSLE